MNPQPLPNFIMLILSLFGFASILAGICIGLGCLYIKFFGHKGKTVYYLKDVPEGETI